MHNFRQHGVVDNAAIDFLKWNIPRARCLVSVSRRADIEMGSAEYSGVLAVRE